MLISWRYCCQLSIMLSTDNIDIIFDVTLHQNHCWQLSIFITIIIIEINCLYGWQQKTPPSDVVSEHQHQALLRYRPTEHQAASVSWFYPLTEHQALARYRGSILQQSTKRCSGIVVLSSNTAPSSASHLSSNLICCWDTCRCRTRALNIVSSESY